MYSLTYSLTLTHTCPYTHTPPTVSPQYIFSHAQKKKLWKCWLSIAEMFCETFSETSLTFTTAPRIWTTNCNHAKSALIEWYKLPSLSENEKKDFKKRTRSQTADVTYLLWGWPRWLQSPLWLAQCTAGGGSSGRVLGWGRHWSSRWTWSPWDCPSSHAGPHRTQPPAGRDKHTETQTAPWIFENIKHRLQAI